MSNARYTYTCVNEHTPKETTQTQQQPGFVNRGNYVQIYTRPTPISTPEETFLCLALSGFAKLWLSAKKNACRRDVHSAPKVHTIHIWWKPASYQPDNTTSGGEKIMHNVSRCAWYEKTKSTQGLLVCRSGKKKRNFHLVPEFFVS